MFILKAGKNRTEKYALRILLQLTHQNAKRNYIETEIAKGVRFYLLIDEKPVGIVSISGSLIPNLYVLPSEQNKGYGTQLLKFAVNHCSDMPTLWVLSTNAGAKRLYERNGFQPTGNTIQHANGIFEVEFRMTKDFNRSSLTK